MKCHFSPCPTNTENRFKGIVRLVDWFYSRTGFLVVMERPRRFMVGALDPFNFLFICQDLFDLVNILGRLEEQVARRIFGQIVNTVIGLFKRHSLVHRDIKVGSFHGFCLA